MVDFRVCLMVLFVFFFKQKTAYEMRISDWSSDVCSSDLLGWISPQAKSASRDRLLAQRLECRVVLVHLQPGFLGILSRGVDRTVDQAEVTGGCICRAARHGKQGRTRDGRERKGVV